MEASISGTSADKAGARSGRWRPLVAAALSLVVPGAGQWYVGERKRAIPYFAVTAALLAAGAVLWSRGTIFLLQLFVQPRWVWALLLGNLAVAVIRLGAALDAYTLAAEKAPRLPRLVTVGGVAALAVLLAVPHLFVGSKAWALLGLLQDVFVVDEPVHRDQPVRFPTTTTTVVGEPIAIDFENPPWPLLRNAPDGLPRPGSAAWNSAPSPVLAPEEVDRITVLLVGGDRGPGRSGNRTDTMIIASVDPRTKQAVLITVSRELVGWPLPEAAVDAPRVVQRQDFIWERTLAWEARNRPPDEDDAADGLPPEETEGEPAEPEEWDPCCWLDRINAIYPATYDLRTEFPGAVDPGLEALRRSLSEGLGIRIDYYLMVDMGGFVDVIDAIGGVRVTSRETMHVFFSPAFEGEDLIELNVEPGEYHMDGRTALAYVRNRTGSSDIVRTRRQRCFVQEVASQFGVGTVLRRFEAISRAVRNHTTTDIPLRFLPTLVTAVGELNRSNIATLAIDQVNYSEGRNYRNLPIVDLDKARRDVQRILAGLSSGDPVSLRDECPPVPRG